MFSLIRIADYFVFFKMRLGGFILLVFLSEYGEQQFRRSWSGVRLAERAR